MDAVREFAQEFGPDWLTEPEPEPGSVPCPPAQAYAEHCRVCLERLEQALATIRPDQAEVLFNQTYVLLLQGYERFRPQAPPRHANAHGRRQHPCLEDVLDAVLLGRIVALKRRYLLPQLTLRPAAAEEERPLLAFGIEPGR